MKRTAPEVCPACGAEVPPRALACPECGADGRTGWNEEATRYDGLDLPDESADGGEIMHEGPQLGHWPKGLPWYWWVAGVILLISMGMLIMTGKW